jgi:hypothetical protein
METGKLDDAVAFLEKACTLAPKSPVALGWLGHAYGTAGRESEALSVLRNIRKIRGRHLFFEEAMVAIGMGKTTEALGLLARACDERQFHLVLLKTDPKFAPIRSHPDFQSILSRVGLAV